MSTIAAPGFLGGTTTSTYGNNPHLQLHRTRSSSCTTIRNSSFSSTRKGKEFPEELQRVKIPHHDVVTQQNPRFDRLQTANEVLIQESNSYEFGQFVAREALSDEEYWAAACLRAESHSEDRHDRYGYYQRKYAEREFDVLIRRGGAVSGQKCSCIVTVKKEDEIVKCTNSKSVVGTLDLSTGLLSRGQTFPGEQVRTVPRYNLDRKGFNQFGYIANLCVSKSVRREGIASNMLQFAIRSAKANGAEHVFVHVHRNNIPAQELYRKMGFERIEKASFRLPAEQNYLLRLKV